MSESWHPATQALLRHFVWEHLPPHLQGVSRPICDLAYEMAERLPQGPELTTGLRKLLEAKDCLVRASLPDGTAEWRPVNHQTHHLLLTIVQQLTRMEHTMATQEELNAIVAQIDALGGTLSTALAGIQADLDALVAANPGLDVTALTASVGALTGLVDTATAIDAQNPAPPVV